MSDPLEKYFRNTIKALLREAVRRRIVRDDARVRDLLKELED